MKQKVISFFQNLPSLPEDQFNEAMALYRKSEGKSAASESFYNRSGYTSGTLENIFYDLKKLHQINEVEIREVKVETLTPVPTGNNSAAPTKEAIFTTAPEDVKVGAKLRDIFPSIEKDDYPDKLKILVADKVTAYHKFVEAHKELFKIIIAPEDLIVVPDEADLIKTSRKDLDEVLIRLSLNPEDFSNKKLASAAIIANLSEAISIQDENNNIELTEGEIFELAKAAIENFELDANITEELSYYEEHGEVLGNHPIFKDENLQKAVSIMDAKELLNRRNNLRSYISKETKKLKKASDDTKQGFEDKIKEYTEELDLIDTRLNNDAKK